MSTPKAQPPLIIENWQAAIAESPAVGFGLFKNAAIDVQTGAVGPTLAPAVMSPVSSTSTFTANAGSDICDIGAGTFVEMTTGVAVQLTTTGTLPAGLALNTTYFLIKQTSTTFKLASSLGNALTPTPIDITDAGTGTHTVTTVNPGTFNSIVDGYIANGSTLFTFTVDSNGRVWFVENGTLRLLFQSNTISNATGHGVMLFTNSDASKTYLIVSKNAAIDICDVTTQAFRRDPVGNSAWTAGWKTFKSNLNGFVGSHEMFLSTNNIIYICDQNWIASIQEINGQIFAPGTAATYTYQQAALTLLSGTNAQCLEQLNTNLLIGDLNTARIYPWDRTSGNPGTPILSPEIGIYKMKNVGNYVWILAGTKGNIYKTYGFLATKVVKIPEYLTGSTATSAIQWGGISAKNGNLICGVSSPQTGNSGVYMIFPDGRIVLDNTALAGGLAPTVISTPTGEAYMFGYVGGFELVGATRWDSFGTVVQSQLYVVGTKTDKAKYSQIELQLAQAGALGGHVRVKYRTDLKSAFANFPGGTVSFALDGTTTSFSADIGLTDLENVQIQLEMDGTGSGTNMTLVLQVRLNP